jgi:hypothetical protein
MSYYNHDSVHEPIGPVFTVPFTAIVTSTAPAAFDIFCVTASTVARVAIREIRLGQYSEFGDSEAELISLQAWTGSTASSSGGAAITPVNVKSHSGAPSANTTVIGPSTTPASTANTTMRLADSWNVAAGWLYLPRPDERITLEPSERFVLRAPVAPTDSITLNGTLMFQELPRP